MQTLPDVKNWTIPGADGEPIIGSTHRPDCEPRGTLIIAHGFKGYKDYGMFPLIADDGARCGFISHRFNFSHSGMTENIDTFEKPELFERDTWNKQVHDLRTVIEHVSSADDGLPHVLFGHSRGGVTVLLTAARYADDDSFLQPAGLITVAAPSGCNFLSEEDQRVILDRGYVESPSSRTGQTLRVGRAFLTEQLDDPENHDLLALVPRIRCPMLIVHGEDDPTVAVSSANAIAEAATAPVTELLVPGADHVMNTQNPTPRDASPSDALRSLMLAMETFLQSL